MRDEGARWLGGGSAPCRQDRAHAPRQREAFIGPVRFLKRPRGQRTPCSQDAVAGPELSEAVECCGRMFEAGLGRRLLPGLATMLLNCVHLM